MSKFTGEGFSAEPFSDDERRQMRERAKHYDEDVAPYARWLALLGMFKTYAFWGIFGATAAIGYAAKSGLLTHASQ